MKKRTSLTGVVLVTFLIGVAGVGYYVFFHNQDKAGNTLADNAFGWKFPTAKFPPTGPGGNLAYSEIRDSGVTPQGLPVRLQIPIIGVDSAIEDALITPDGRMDVPAGSKNVAWFSLGPHPGKVGSAVIGGHFGIKDGVPFVFYNLDKLRVGDVIYIVDDRGDTIGFQVRSIKLFNRNDDATTVFTSDDGLAHLNLITCEGIWNRVNDTYPQRRVVFADVLPKGSAAAELAPSFGRSLTAEAIATFTRPLAMGDSGMDVANLQVILEQKGFLAIPPGIVKGGFGPLTREAVARYQTSVGLPPSGIFDLPTRERLILGESPEALNPVLPSTAISTPPMEIPSFFQTLLRTAKSLYATPLDGLITSSLLVLIVLVALKIIRR